MHEKIYIFSFLLLLTFSDLLPQVKPEIQTIETSSDDRAFIFLQDFGFRDPGQISVSVSSLSVTTTSSKKALVSPTQLSFMGFYYSPSPARNTIKLALLQNTCIMGHPFVFPILTLNKKPDLNQTILVTIPDLYYIFFINCAINTSVSMSINLETYNFNPNNDSPDYIDDHFSNLPTALFVFSLFFLILLVPWTHECNKNKHFLHKVHILMSILLVLKFLELISHANSQYSIRQTGTPHAWNVLWLALHSLRNSLFVALIIIIRSEWTISQPYTIFTAVSLQIIASICFTLIRLFGPSSKDYRYWAVTYYAADFLSCVTMLLPVGSFVGHLPGSYSKGKRLTREKVFETFETAVYVYVGLTRFVIFAMRAVGSYEYLFFTVVLEMMVEFVFYVVVYSTFWPSERYEYAALESIREEDFSA